MRVINENGVLVKLWDEHVKIEDKAVDQLKTCASLPFIYKWIAAMPDAHWGMGSTVGSVIPTEDAIIPAAVGVDIGCGIDGHLTSWTREDMLEVDLGALNGAIQSAVPHGRTDNGGPNDRGAWNTVPRFIDEIWANYLFDDFIDVLGTTPKARKANHLNHLGTLGTGNHFIELAYDEQDRVWLLIHSGSRGVGANIASYHMKTAKELMKKFHITLPDPNLAYFPQGTAEFDAYIKGMFWAQKFAKWNRVCMRESVKTAMQRMHWRPLTFEDSVMTPHNHASRERHFGKDVWVTRKGACEAKPGQSVVIPGSMGGKSYIVEGKGSQENRDSFFSCSHGAGRAMSRTEARKTFTVEDHARAMEGVVCRLDADVLDETTGAYKDIDAVIASQKDLINVQHTLKGFLNVKG